jgi:hypothetical protein
MTLPLPSQRPPRGDDNPLEGLLKPSARGAGTERQLSKTPLPPPLDDLGPADSSLLHEMELLAAENEEVLAALGTGVPKQGGDLDVDDIKIQEIVKEYEELLGEKEELLEAKTETIRQLHQENQDLKEQLEHHPPPGHLLRRTTCTPGPKSWNASFRSWNTSVMSRSRNARK